MMYVTDRHPKSLGVWALCASGVVTETFPGPLGRQRAARALRPALELRAAADPGALIPWESDPAIAYVGEVTDDRRVLNDFAFRAFPHDLLAQTETAYGHDGAFLVGRVDAGSVDGNKVVASGVIDPAITGSADVLRMLENDMLTRVSVDYTAERVELEILTEDEDGFPVDYLERYHGVTMGGATLVSMSAFPNARVRLSSAYSVAASAELEPPVEPPVDWFQDPQLAGRTRLTVTDEGRVFGHLAPWGECHIGIQGQCVTAPRSASSYGWFTLGTVRCAEGCEIPIGTITMDTGHADKDLRARAATRHYDNTGTAIADVAVGEDDHGIWVAGALRSTATPEQVRALRAARLSGDWRKVNGALELVAALAVNTGGFPVYEEAVAADGTLRTVIASLDLPQEPVSRGDEALRAALAPVLAEHAERLHQRVHATT